MLSEVTNPVIFLAVSRTSGWWLNTPAPPTIKNEGIMFPLVKINVGGGYDNTTGVFTCPSDGYYALHWSVTSTDDRNRCSSAITNNGVEVIGNQVGGNLATFHMNRNDRAWIKATSSCTVVPNHSSFSGFKIL